MGIHIYYVNKLRGVGMRRCSGIYQIRNIVNGNLYIGQSINLDNRRRGHFESLRKGNHHNTVLQKAFNKYGEQNLLFEILIYLDADKEILTLFEQRFMDILKPIYNLCPTAGSYLGYHHTAETRKKIGKIGKGRPAWNKGIHTKGKLHTEESKQKMRNIFKNRTEETFKKISQSKIEWHKTHQEQWKEVCEKMANTKAKVYPGVIAPDGTVYPEIRNLHQFAQEHQGISDGSLRNLFRGARSTVCGGWRLHTPSD